MGTVFCCHELYPDETSRKRPSIAIISIVTQPPIKPNKSPPLSATLSPTRAEWDFCQEEENESKHKVKESVEESVEESVDDSVDDSVSASTESVEKELTPL